MSRGNLSHERPSRLSRVVVIVTALAVGFLTVWILTPIVLANLAATSAAVPQQREAASTPPEAARTAPDVASTPRVPAGARREAKDLSVSAPPTQPVQPDVSAQPAQAETPAQAEATAGPEPSPAPVVAAVSPSALSMSAEAAPGPAEAASSIPWPVATAEVAPATGMDVVPSAAPDDFGPVPLPRRRPNLTLAAHLAEIPLPRPRPEIAAPEAPVPDHSGENALFDRMHFE